MIIDSPNELKQWLTGYLPPLCDADPEVLAKYCLALVKKDRPDEELKASLIEQLDVFLKLNTAKFVEKFLEVANNKSYMSKEKLSPVTSLPGDDATKPAAVSSPNSPVRIPTNDPPPTATTGLSEKAVIPPASDPSSQPPLPPLPPPVQSIPYPPPETTPPYPPPKKEEFPLATKTGKSEPKERERDERRGRRGSRPRDKSRSRSRDRERGRRSRSRGRSNRSKYDDRRRRSPHRASTLKRYSRRSRSRSPRWSRSPNARRSRSRDRRSRSRNRSRSLSPKKHQSRHKSRSRTPVKVNRAESPVSSSRKTPNKEEKEDTASPDTNAGDTKAPPPPLVHSVVSIPHQDRYSSSKSQRCRDYDEQGFCMKGDQCPFDHGADPVVLEGGAIDFPSPLTGVPPMASVPGIGYPLSGPSLPRDIPGRAFLRHPPPLRPAQFGEYTPNNPGLWGSEPLLPSNPFYGGRGRGMVGPPPRFPGPPPPLAPQEMGRELISVPVNGTNQGKGGIRASLAQRLGPASGNAFAPNGVFATNPVSHGAPKYPNSPENCTLELRKIPNGLNTISHLNQHFAKFGTIINIQVHHEGDPESALVTFSTHSQANAAYRSTEAVLNNRFIKLFWHNTSKGEVPTSTTTTNLQRTVHDRLGLRNPNKSLNNKVQTMEAVSTENEKVILTKGSLIKTVFNPSAIKSGPLSAPEAMEEAASTVVMTTTQPEKLVVKPATTKLVPPDSTQHQLTSVEIKKQKIEAIRKQQELLRAELLAKQKVQKQKAEALKLRNEVESRTRQLLKEQMQHVKLLINKLETNKSTMKAEEIKLLFNTIKTLQNAVETTKAQLASSYAAPPPPLPPPQPKTKVQLDKEILDTELEVYTIQSEGGDVTKIRARLQLLKSQMLLLKGLKHPKMYSHVAGRGSAIAKHMGMGRGRGQLRGRGRGRGRSFGGVNAVDRRSTCINASGFEREDKEEVLAHFVNLGNLTTYSWDNLTPAITVQYATRRDAEKAINEGRNLGDRLLTLTWVSEATSSISNQPVTTTTPAMALTNEPHVLQKTLVSSSAAPHSTSVMVQEDEEEITEEIVEEVETEEIGGYIYDEEIEEEEEEEEEEGEEEGTRSWRR